MARPVGRRVTVLEAAGQVGGMAATREFAPGFKASCAHLTWQLDAAIELLRHSFAARLVEALGWQSRRLKAVARVVRETPCLALSYPAGYDRLPDAAAAVAVTLFVVVLGGIVAGLIIGFVWEWLREYKHRREASVKAREVNKLEREVSRLKTEKHQGKDEVLAILDEAG